MVFVCADSLRMCVIEWTWTCSARCWIKEKKGEENFYNGEMKEKERDFRFCYKKVAEIREESSLKTLIDNKLVRLQKYQIWREWMCCWSKWFLFLIFCVNIFVVYYKIIHT